MDLEGSTSWANMSEELFAQEDMDTAHTGSRSWEEIPLSAAVHQALCRRSQRRFRELQATSGAKIRLDRVRSVVRVCGTAPEVLEIRRKLEAISGVRHAVPTAVWCELMRTRLAESSERSMLLRMQKQSGCRIHVERSKQEVCLFGACENTELGLKLLEEFRVACTELAIPCKPHTMPDQVVKAIAEAYEVTVNVETRQVVVYGLREAVKQASRAVENFLERGTLPPDATVDTDDEFDDDFSSVTSDGGSWCTGSVCHESNIPALPLDKPAEQAIGRDERVA
mmetsp:Transcript_35515/g.81325  ORF Transcript_35515/g.81325 Transcript_35515/m.81325 type:complete len:282 (-) Transcript_35515:136-981(-)